MATGFGGDAKVALLTGFMSGISDAEEKKRRQEREDIINRQIETNIRATEESMARQARAEQTANANALRARQIQEAAAERERAETAAAQYTERRQAAARQRALEQRVQTVTQARPELLEQYSPEQITQLVEEGFGDEILQEVMSGPEDPDEMEQIRIAKGWADLEEKQRENKAAEDVELIMQDESSLALRAAITKRDQAGVSAATSELIAKGFEPKAVEQVTKLFAGAQKEQENAIGLDPETVEHVEYEAKAEALRVTQQLDDPGAIEQHIATLRQAQANAPPGLSQRDILFMSTLLQELRKKLLQLQAG